jgi:hypothetical protein
MTEPLVWLWICGTKEAKVQVSHFVHNGIFGDTYDWLCLSYLPTSNGRLEDRPANNKLIRTEVHFNFLLKEVIQAKWKYYQHSTCL